MKPRSIEELEDWVKRLEQEVKDSAEGTREHDVATHDLERVRQALREAQADAKAKADSENLTPSEIADRVDRRRW